VGKGVCILEEEPLLDKDIKLDMLRKMIIIRHLEDKWRNAYLNEEIGDMFHT